MLTLLSLPVCYYLYPSFPIINALSDILKGYMNMGVGRWMFATMLTLSACVGIVMTLIFLRIPHWGYDGIIEIIQTIVLSAYHYCGLVFNVYIAKQYIMHCMMVTALGFGLKQVMVTLVCIWLWQHSLGAMAGSFLGVHFASASWPAA